MAMEMRKNSLLPAGAERGVHLVAVGVGIGGLAATGKAGLERVALLFDVW